MEAARRRLSHAAPWFSAVAASLRSAQLGLLLVDHQFIMLAPRCGFLATHTLRYALGESAG